MSEYRYVVFPYGKQPTTGEAAEFRNYSDVLAGKYAIGICRKTRGLAIAFEAAAFDYGMQTHRGFQALIQKWEVRGAKVVERLAFVKDATALRPLQSNLWTPEVHAAIDRSTSTKKMIANKRQVAREAVARSLLSVHQTLQRHALLRRLAGFVPHMLIAFVGLAIIFMGVSIHHRLRESSGENRRDSIVRVIDDPMNESLESQLLESQAPPGE